MLTIDATVSVLTDKDNKLKGIFFQDADMEQSFKSWPEFLCFDATYKLLEVPLLVLLCKDCSGLLSI